MDNLRRSFLIFILILLTCICNAAELDMSTTLKSFKDLDNKMLSTLMEKRNEYQNQLLATHPVIIGLFSVDGGEFLLYRPHKSTIQIKMPQAINYRIAGIIEHTTMVTYELATSYFNTNDQVKKITF